MVLITARVGLPDNFQPFHWGLSSALVDNVPLVEVDLHVPKKMWQWRTNPDSCLFYAGDLWIFTTKLFLLEDSKNRSYYELRFWSTHQQYNLKFFESIRHSLFNFEHPSQVSRDSRTLLDNVFVCCTWNTQMWDLCWRFYKKDLRTYGCNMSESSTHANETPFRYEAFMMPMNPLKNSVLELGRVRSTSGIDWHVPRGRGLILRSKCDASPKKRRYT